MSVDLFGRYLVEGAMNLDQGLLGSASISIKITIFESATTENAMLHNLKVIQ